MTPGVANDTKSNTLTDRNRQVLVHLERDVEGRLKESKRFSWRRRERGKTSSLAFSLYSSFISLIHLSLFFSLSSANQVYTTTGFTAPEIFPAAFERFDSLMAFAGLPREISTVQRSVDAKRKLIPRYPAIMIMSRYLAALSSVASYYSRLDIVSRKNRDAALDTPTRRLFRQVSSLKYTKGVSEVLHPAALYRNRRVSICRPSNSEGTCPVYPLFSSPNAP